MSDRPWRRDTRAVIASEAKQSIPPPAALWIASSQGLLAMTWRWLSFRLGAFLGATSRRRLAPTSRLPPQPVDEHIHQAQHGRLPAGLVVQIAHADQRAQQLLRTDVGADLAGRDSAIEQRTNSLGQRFERIGVEF